MPDKEEYVKIAEREADAFKALMSCRAACEEVVRSVVKEWETVKMSENEIWRRMIEKYGLDVKLYDYVFNPETQSLLRSKKEIDYLKSYDKARKYVDEMFTEASQRTDIVNDNE